MNGVYRTTAPEKSPTPRLWKRVLCWVLGHNWLITRINRAKMIALWHAHELAGCDAYCARCGRTWLDAGAMHLPRNEGRGS